MKQYNLLQTLVVLMLLPQVQGSFEERIKDALMTLRQRKFVNDFKEDFDFNCPAGEIIKRIRSVHGEEDRRYEFTCAPLHNAKIGICETETLRNNADHIRPANDYVDEYKCPHLGIFGGAKTEHFGHLTLDRSWRFSCCIPLDDVPQKCTWTDWKNSYDNILDFTVPDGGSIRGIQSDYQWESKDRIFKFWVCHPTTQFVGDYLSNLQA